MHAIKIIIICLKLRIFDFHNTKTVYTTVDDDNHSGVLVIPFIRLTKFSFSQKRCGGSRNAQRDAHYLPIPNN